MLIIYICHKLKKYTFVNLQKTFLWGFYALFLSVKAQKKEDFTLAILPDTQIYANQYPQIFKAQTKWISKNYKKRNIVFTLHLGDIVDTPNEKQWKNAKAALDILNKNKKTPYSISAGNHDIFDFKKEDFKRDLQKEPYFEYFSPTLQKKRFKTFKGADKTGFNSYHIFKANGQQFLVLALDWRPSKMSFQWANKILKKHKNIPTIITTHQLLQVKPLELSDLGKKIWDTLVKNNNQVFMTLNGHHSGVAKIQRKNNFGNPVLMVVMDFQSNFKGGNGMLALLTFSKSQNKLIFRSYSPWVANIPKKKRTKKDQISNVKDGSCFEVDFDFKKRLNF